MIEMIVNILILAIVTEAITEIIVDSKLFESLRTKIVNRHIDIVNTISMIQLIIDSKESKISWPELTEKFNIPPEIQRDVITNIDRIYAKPLNRVCPLFLKIKSKFFWWLSSILSCGYCFSVYAAAMTAVFSSINVSNISGINYFISVFLLHRLSNCIHILISRVSTERMKYFNITIDRNKND